MDWACAPFVESGGAGPRENARLVIEADGSVSVYVGSSALGQGLETVFAQIAGDALGLPMERLRVLHGSTTYVHEGFGTYHSRAVVMGGSAILNGCENLVEAIRLAARDRLGLPNAEIVVADGEVRAGEGRAAALAEFAGLTAEGTFANSHRTYSLRRPCVPRGGRRAQAGTGRDSRLCRDRGCRPRDQSAYRARPGHRRPGAGTGRRVLEHSSTIVDAQIFNASLADYLVPLASDFPNVRAITLELRRSKTNPLGAKGAGEGGMVAVAACVATALAAATGKNVRKLPLSPSAVWHLIQD